MSPDMSHSLWASGFPSAKRNGWHVLVQLNGILGSTELYTLKWLRWQILLCIFITIFQKATEGKTLKMRWVNSSLKTYQCNRTIRPRSHDWELWKRKAGQGDKGKEWSSQDRGTERGKRRGDGREIVRRRDSGEGMVSEGEEGRREIVKGRDSGEGGKHSLQSQPVLLCLALPICVFPDSQSLSPSLSPVAQHHLWFSLGSWAW